jgi:putative ABC transport system permease protein
MKHASGLAAQPAPVRPDGAADSGGCRVLTPAGIRSTVGAAEVDRGRAASSDGRECPAAAEIRGSIKRRWRREAKRAPRRMRMPLAVLREAVAAARAARVASILTMTVVAVLCAVVVLTTGRTVGAQNAIVSRIDSAGTRSIVVRAPASAGLDTGVLGRLANASQISSVVAFGAADDVTNAAFAGGERVSLRAEYVAQPEPLLHALTSNSSGRPVLASPAAQRALGLADGVGAVSSVASGATFDIDGVLELPDSLAFLDPVVAAPASPDPTAPQAVTVLVVVAASSEQVEAVTALVVSMLGVTNPEKVTVTTSAQLAALRGAVQSQLGAFSRSLTALVFAVGAVLVAAILFGLVMLRRKDFGRRRALGASRPLIVALLLTQVAVLGSIGAVVGCLGSGAVLLALGDPLPTLSFVAAAAVLATLTAVAASGVPAVVASTRDPLRELRVA